MPIIILLMALSMARGKNSSMHHSDEEEKNGKSKGNPAIVPLAVPMFAGPAAISTIIIYHHHFSNIEGYIYSSLVVSICVFILWVALSSSHKIQSIVNQTGMKVITRIMGIVLVSISVEMIANGIKILF